VAAVRTGLGKWQWHQLMGVGLGPADAKATTSRAAAGAFVALPPLPASAGQPGPGNVLFGGAAAPGRTGPWLVWALRQPAGSRFELLGIVEPGFRKAGRLRFVTLPSEGAKALNLSLLPRCGAPAGTRATVPVAL